MKLMKQIVTCIALTIVAPLTGFAGEDGLSGKAATQVAAADAQSMTAGVVKRVDPEQNKLTLSHGPIANLGMPAMTMVFRVADPSLLGTVSPGDKINFAADKVNGVFTVVRLIPAK